MKRRQVKERKGAGAGRDWKDRGDNRRKKMRNGLTSVQKGIKCQREEIGLKGNEKEKKRKIRLEKRIRGNKKI